MFKSAWVPETMLKKQGKVSLEETFLVNIERTARQAQIRNLTVSLAEFRKTRNFAYAQTAAIPLEPYVKKLARSMH